jgi:hypothetical protein
VLAPNNQCIPTRLILDFYACTRSSLTATH